MTYASPPHLLFPVSTFPKHLKIQTKKRPIRKTGLFAFYSKKIGIKYRSKSTPPYSPCFVRLIQFFSVGHTSVHPIIIFTLNIILYPKILYHYLLKFKDPVGMAKLDNITFYEKKNFLLEHHASCLYYCIILYFHVAHTHVRG